jgi:hypothetical protein
MTIADFITLSGLVIAFAIFLTMAVKELIRGGIAAVRTLKFQLAIATFVWLIGESLTVIFDIGYYGSFREALEIHTLSMAIFALIILLRLPQLVKRAH